MDHSLFPLESPRLPGPICRGHRDAGPGSSARARASPRRGSREPCRSYRGERWSRRQSQGTSPVGDLPVPARRPEPDGPVRPQARAHEAPGQALSRPARDPLRQAGGQAAGLAVSSFSRMASREWCSASSSRIMSRIVDDLTLVRSMTTESVDHETALRLIHTGKILAGRPTWGSWVVYALGTENQNLPAYVVLSDPGGLPVDGVRNWSSGWLPAIDQGTPFRCGRCPGAQPEEALRRHGRGPRLPASFPGRAQPCPREAAPR